MDITPKIMSVQLCTNATSDPPYYTSETIYNHSKQFIIRQQSSPSFLKSSLSNTPLISKNDQINKSYTNNNHDQFQRISRISQNLYQSALKRDQTFKSLLRQKQIELAKNRQKLTDDKVCRIKLKQIIEHQQQTLKIKSVRKGTLQDQQFLKFQMDENLNYVQICAIKEQEQQIQMVTQRTSQKDIQQNNKSITKNNATNTKQSSEHKEQHKKSKSIKQNETDQQQQNKIKYHSHQASRKSNQDILLFNQGQLSSINRIQSKDFWLSSQQIQQSSNKQSPLHKSVQDKYIQIEQQLIIENTKQLYRNNKIQRYNLANGNKYANNILLENMLQFESSSDNCKTQKINKEGNKNIMKFMEQNLNNTKKIQNSKFNPVLSSPKKISNNDDECCLQEIANINKNNVRNSNRQKNDRNIKRCLSYHSSRQTTNNNNNKQNGDTKHCQTVNSNIDKATSRKRTSSLSSHSQHGPKGVYQEILSGYSTAKLLAITKQYQNNKNKTSVSLSKAEKSSIIKSNVTEQHVVSSKIIKKNQIISENQKQKKNRFHKKSNSHYQVPKEETLNNVLMFVNGNHSHRRHR